MPTTQTPNMALYEWVNSTDYFSHTQLVSNWGSIDNHDHSPGKGLPVHGDSVANGGSMVAGSITLAALTSAVLDNMFVIGDIVCSIGTTRTGFLLMDGSTFTTSSYPTLASLCGPFQLGNEASGFTRLPDFRGRLPIGSQNNATGTATRATAWPLGYKNGATFTGPGNEESHVQLSTEIATHNHTLTDNGHSHSDSGHGHGVNDPGHGHGVSDPGHSHGMTPDGGNLGLSWSIPMVPYGTGIISGTGSGGNFFGGSSFKGWKTGNTDGSGTGIGINGSGTGVSIQTGAANIRSSTTGITLATAGSSNPFNIMPPVIGINWFVKHD